MKMNLKQISSSGNDRGDILQFGPFSLQPDGRLLKCGNLIRLSPKEQEVLRLLVMAEGQIVSKDEILQTVWCNEEVSETSLTRCIHCLRENLKTSACPNDYIETVYGRGYRLKVTVNRICQVSHQKLQLSRVTQTTHRVYEAYMEARYLCRRSNSERIKRAMELYQLAIQWDSNYTPAYIGLADCYRHLTVSGTLSLVVCQELIVG